MAAGPLERLLVHCGAEYIERVKEEARHNKRFLYALANVWLSEDDVIYPQFVSILTEEHHLTDPADIEALWYRL